MYLFLFTVIPIYFFLFRELEKKRYNVRGCGFGFFCGAITSVVYCFIGFLLFTSYRLPEFSFKNNFLYFFLYGTVFPVSCCLLIYLLLGKNGWSFKMLMFSDVVTAFYAVFLPYRIVSTYDVADPFCIFVLPCVVVCCLYILRKITVYVVLTNAKLYKKIIFGFITVSAVLFVPAVAETLYFINKPLWLRCVVEFGTALLAVGSFFLFRGDPAYVNERIAEIFKPVEIVAKADKKEKSKKKAKHEKTKSPKDMDEASEDTGKTSEPESVKPGDSDEPADAETAETTQGKAVKTENKAEISASVENVDVGETRHDEENVSASVSSSDDAQDENPQKGAGDKSPAPKTKKNGKKTSKKKK
ncbi:MAG: hypothetical protein K5751_10820 [Treponemataceae bacterium]|nr:hypothetical protein [Treponemataceae bacterium]